MKTCFMTVGIGASGKSTFLKKNYPYLRHVNADIFRTVAGGYVYDKDAEAEVWEKVKQLLHITCDSERDFCFEATNLTKRRREEYIKLLHSFGYKVIALYFDTPLSTCLERNSKREDNHRIPDEIVKDMHLRLQLPKLDEGFLAVHIVREGVVVS